jgi:hypothetical protein
MSAGAFAIEKASARKLVVALVPAVIVAMLASYFFATDFLRFIGGCV